MLFLETPAIRTQLERDTISEHSVPLYLSSSFVFDDAEDMRLCSQKKKKRNIYSRFSNPILSLSKKICTMEGAVCYAFATGMAAVFFSTLQLLVNLGEIISFGGSVLIYTCFIYDLFSKMEY
jgi:O-succinylhomoserine sulfhydrylase